MITKYLFPFRCTPAEFHRWLNAHCFERRSFWYRGQRLHLEDLPELVESAPIKIEITGRLSLDDTAVPVFRFLVYREGRSKISITAVCLISEPDIEETFEHVISMLRLGYGGKQ